MIGWWWYISRKKERLISHDSPEGPQTTIDLRTSPGEVSNGLVEKGTNDTETHTHLSPKDGNLRTQHEKIPQVRIKDMETASSVEQTSEESVPHQGRIRQEKVHKLSHSTMPLPDNEDNLQILTNHDDPENGSFPVLVMANERHLVKDPASVPQATAEEVNFSCESTTTANRSNVERPEPEGEVAKHHNTMNTQHEIAVCAVMPGTVQSVFPVVASSLEMVQDLHQHILTSSPTTPAPTTAQDSTTLSVTPEDIQIQSIAREEHDLELLASGLITDVISAATKEVLAATSSQVTVSQVICSRNTPLASGRICLPQEPTTETQQHYHPQTNPFQVGCQCTEATEKEEQGLPNGCSSASIWDPVEASQIVNQTTSAQKGTWPTPSYQVSQSTPVLKMKKKCDEAAMLAEDSACSMLYYEDDTSGDDLKSSLFDNQIDVIQVTDLSAKGTTHSQSMVETIVEATLAVTEGNLVNDVCEIKRLSGMSLRNGAHVTCEVETDQSGGSDVNSMDSVDSGCTMGAGESQSNHTASLSTELIIWEIEVPKHLVGRLIGKQGRYVSFLKQNSGAKIYISTLPYTQEFQICHIEGTQQQVDKTLSLIGKKFKDLDLTNLYAPPPPPLTLPSLPMTSWLLLPSGVTVEVIVVNIVSAGHIFVQQHTHPTYHALRSLDQQMFLCYSQSGTPALPSPAEVGVICAAPAADGAWWRAQVITFYKETNEVEIRYVDYGGYDRVKIDSLRQIRSDFVTLPFQGAEVLLDNIVPLPGEESFSAEATSALDEMTRGVAMLAQVSNYDNNTGLPLVRLWNMVGDEVISVNRMLAERGLGVWMEGF